MGEGVAAMGKTGMHSRAAAAAAHIETRPDPKAPIQ